MPRDLMKALSHYVRMAKAAEDLLGTTYKCLVYPRRHSNATTMTGLFEAAEK